MVAQVRKRFWIEASVGSIFVLLFVATLLHQWPRLWRLLISAAIPFIGRFSAERCILRRILPDCI